MRGQDCRHTHVMPPSAVQALLAHWPSSGRKGAPSTLGARAGEAGGGVLQLAGGRARTIGRRFAAGAVITSRLHHATRPPPSPGGSVAANCAAAAAAPACALQGAPMLPRRKAHVRVAGHGARCVRTHQAAGPCLQVVEASMTSVCGLQMPWSGCTGTPLVFVKRAACEGRVHVRIRSVCVYWCARQPGILADRRGPCTLVGVCSVGVWVHAQ